MPRTGKPIGRPRTRNLEEDNVAAGGEGRDCRAIRNRHRTNLAKVLEEAAFVVETEVRRIHLAQVGKAEEAEGPPLDLDSFNKIVDTIKVLAANQGAIEAARDRLTGAYGDLTDMELEERMRKELFDMRKKLGMAKLVEEKA